MQRIAIIGAGAVGCGLGFLLSRAGREITLIVGRPLGPRDFLLEQVADLLNRVIPTRISDNIRGAHWLKLITNLNNALPALIDGTFHFLPVKLAARVAAARVERILTPWPLLGSTLQSLRRKRSTEIDYLNGEVVELGKKTGTSTPLNARIVELVHQVEQTGAFFNVDEVRRKFLYL